MSCPYRTHTQFVNWLVKYKGWKRIDAKKLNIHTMRKMYYSEPPIPNKVSNLPVIYERYTLNMPERDTMDFDEACQWYVKQLYKERHAK